MEPSSEGVLEDTSLYENSALKEVEILTEVRYPNRSGEYG